MKDRIIQETISSLQKEGLKFSVDTLAERLKVSKKTIYKYFPNKEALALAVYKKFYLDVNQKIQALRDNRSSVLNTDLLCLYYETKKMTRSDVFNKFQLNDVILTFVEQQNKIVWKQITNAFILDAALNGTGVLKIIVDGAFEKLLDLHEDPAQVIKRLEMLL